ncbi:MAG: CoA-binding protein [Burkholderiales bacterium]
MNMTDAEMRQLFEGTKTIAVVGLSDNPARPSHGVAHYLQQHGFRIIPVNPKLNEVLGEKCYASLRDVPEKIDMVDCFRRSEEMLPIARDAVALGVRCLWMQIGVINHEAAKIAEDGGVKVVLNKCTKIEHRRTISK